MKRCPRIRLHASGAVFKLTLYSFEGVTPDLQMQIKFTFNHSGGYYEKVTPVPIPNTEVKLLSADDTWLVTTRESRSPPDLYQSPVLSSTGLCANVRYSRDLGKIHFQILTL